ncbi:hypothetical protein MMC29_000693 [Sticta canariensis]|nr:hypothetical protein [Sticta canariensis]
MNGQGHEYPGGRKNQGQPLRNRVRDRGSLVGYGRQSRNSDCYDVASIHDNRQEESNSRRSYSPTQFPPRLPYNPTQVSARDQYASKMPDLNKLSQETFPKARPLDPQHHNSVEHVIPSQPFRSGVPNRSGTHALPQWNPESIYSSRHIDPSLIEGSPLVATSHRNYQQRIGHRSSTDAIIQRSNCAHPPNTLEKSEEQHKFRRISSHAQPLHVEIKPGADGKPQGLVRFINGQMEYREAKENIWKAAVYHEDLRDTLIAEASLLGEYDHARERGIAANDVTSFLPNQKEWGPDRDTDWPKIENNVLHRFERGDYPIPEYKPTVWYNEGRVVLDADNHPILDYKVLPATLSSELSGRDMEAMKRLDLRISRKDFRARMPRTILKKGDANGLVERPLYTLSAIGMRTARFRKENGLISWTEREGTDSIRSHTMKRMPQAHITANSTQGMSVPTLFEQEDSQTSNKGKYLARAGRHALSDDTRKERARKENQRLQRLHADHMEGETLPETHNSLKRKRKRVFFGDEEYLKKVKRMRENVAFPASLPASALALPSPYMPVTQAPPKSEVDAFQVPPKTNYKRSREEASTNDGQELQGPSKRHKEAHIALDQLMAKPINQPKAPPRPFHRRAGGIFGGIAAGNEISGTVSTITPTSLIDHAIEVEPKQIRQRHVEENRCDGSIGLDVEESDPKIQSADINQHFPSPAPPIAGDHSQKAYGFVNSDPLPVESQSAVPETEDDLFSLFIDRDAYEL